MWEENDAGSVCTWGRVLTWEPPRVFAFSWLIGPDWSVPGPDAEGSRAHRAILELARDFGLEEANRPRSRFGRIAAPFF